MSANTAMNIFAKAVVQRGKIPFEIRGDKPVASEENEGLKAFRALRAMAEAGAFPEMSLEEINEEIRAAMREKFIFPTELVDGLINHVQKSGISTDASRLSGDAI